VEITIKMAGITVESFFTRARLYKDARCDDIAQKCLEAFSSYGLRAPLIVVRIGDQAFNYDLSFTLFSGNGTVKISSEKLEVHFQNIVTNKDFEIVMDCIAKLFEHAPLPDINSNNIIANAHATADSVETMQQYLLRYADPSKQVVYRGIVAYIVSSNWPKEIRLMVDRSLVVPGGMYLMWSTTFDGKLSRDVLKALTEACEEATSILDLKFPMKTQ